MRRILNDLLSREVRIYSVFTWGFITYPERSFWLFLVHLLSWCDAEGAGRGIYYSASCDSDSVVSIMEKIISQDLKPELSPSSDFEWWCGSGQLSASLYLSFLTYKMAWLYH